MSTDSPVGRFSAVPVWLLRLPGRGASRALRGGRFVPTMPACSAARNELVNEDGSMILAPLLLQVVLTIVVYIALGVAKKRAVRRGEVDLERRALHGDAWPESVVKINNNIRNQFEVPVLFYVLVIVLWQLGAAGGLAQAAAWLFVGSRAVHAYVHTGTNYVPVRRAVFLFGCLMVLLMAGLATVALLAR